MHQAVTPIAPEPSSTTVAFDGLRGDFRRLLTRGALLELVTLGFYRFWLTTDMRRHLWAHTSVGGDAAEYTGTAKELLIGFLFALAILVPVYVTYFLIGLEAERWQAFASVPLFILYYLFMSFAMYRARRYRLTRTIWRGVRFWMSGSGWHYALRSAAWDIGVIITLGLLLPWRIAALERYKMQHTRYGNLQGEFITTGGEFFRRGWWLWLLAWPSAVLIVPLPFIWGVYKAIEWRWWIEGLRLGEVRFESRLDGADLLGVYWKVIGWATLFFVLLLCWIGGIAAVASALYGASGTQMAQAMQNPAAFVAIGFGYVVLALAFSLVARLYLFRDVWARVVTTTRVFNLAAADDVRAEGELAGALGEGLADSLDIGGF